MTTGNNLRNRSTSQASSTRLSSSWQQQRANDHDPSRKGKRRRRNPYLPLAGVIFSAIILLVVLSTLLNEGMSGIPYHSLRTLLGFGIFFQPDSIDYSKLPLCINNYMDLPELWKPIKVVDAKGKPKRLFMNEKGEPQAKRQWTEQETLLATRALHQALDELVRYYNEEMTPDEVQSFQPDGINSLLDMAYGQEGLFQRTALKAARDQFVLVAAPFMMHRTQSDQDMHKEADKKYDNEDKDENEKEKSDSHDSEDANEGEDEQRQKQKMLLDQDVTQNDSPENDDEVKGRDAIVKEQPREDEGEQGKDDLSEDNNEQENRRRLEEETDDTPNSRRYNVRFQDSCRHQYSKMKLADYGHYIVEQYGRDHIQEHDPELDRAYNAIIASVRAMIHSCGTLDRILQLNLTSELFEDPDQDSSVVFDYVISAIALVEMSTIPDIDFPSSRAAWFVGSLWNYLSTYNLKYARDSPQHYWNPDAIAHAWLATHIAYLPSGYGRHANKVQDAPYLYQYIRENFYYAMEHGRIDLVSEFVDLIRTYGCTEETDYQLRDGTRFVMNKFYEEMGGQWIDLEKSDSHYHKIHVPWAGSAAVMLTGDSEPITPGSYGYAFYAMVRNQDSEDAQDDVTQM